MKIKSAELLLIFLVFWAVILGCIIFRFQFPNNTKKVHEDICPMGKVCMDQHAFDTLLSKQASQIKPVQYDTSATKQRDMKVLFDPLYPALNRTDRKSFEGVVNNTINRNFNIPTQTHYDSYRLIGYITNENDQNGRTWKLMGKQRDRNRADFYMIPVNNNYDVKIQITDDMVVGEKLRDIDTIPSEIQFNSPLLTDTPYKFVELPKSSLDDAMYF